MDKNQYFNKPAKNITEREPRTVCWDGYLWSKPLVYGLQKNPALASGIILQQGTPTACAQRLLDGEVEIGIVPSLAYAQAKGSWKIVPDLCIASHGSVKSVCLFFKKDMKQIHTVALDNRARSSAALLKILMQEKHEIKPEYLLMPPDMERMFDKADAALIIGDEALRYGMAYPYYLDLGEEWNDMTGLPFVFSICAGNELILNNRDVQIMQLSYKLGAENMDEISFAFSQNQTYSKEFYSDFLKNNICYSFAEEEKQGLSEFFRYAFYFGLIEHIPDLHFYGEHSL